MLDSIDACHCAQWRGHLSELSTLSVWFVNHCAFVL